MWLLIKLIVFVAGFSIAFFLLRTSPEYHHFLAVDLQDLGGVPWLYSIVGMIFSILAAFIIQSEWSSWNGLLNAIRNEVSALERLRHASSWFPEDSGRRIRAELRRYLAFAIEEGWGSQGRRDEDNEAAEEILGSLLQTVLQASHRPQAGSTAENALTEVVRSRRDRLDYAARRMPRLLRYTLMFAGGLVITLSLFIGVRSVWLDYLFTTSIALLAYLVYLVADDLDNPSRPGIWHVTSRDYQRLLIRMQADESADPGSKPPDESEPPRAPARRASWV